MAASEPYPRKHYGCLVLVLTRADDASEDYRRVGTGQIYFRDWFSDARSGAISCAVAEGVYTKGLSFSRYHTMWVLDEDLNYFRIGVCTALLQCSGTSEAICESTTRAWKWSQCLDGALD